MSTGDLIITLIIMSFVLSFILGCLGCGKQCIETPDCGFASSENEDISLAYLSLPMCGGCLTYEWGCNTCLYPQKCTTSFGSYEDGKNLSGIVINCDDVYYGNSCFVCGSTEQRCYSGIFAGEADSSNSLGCYCGDTNSGNESICGVFDGCVCGGETGGNYFAYIGDFIEYSTKNMG